jgi:hypothetical protein
VGKLDGFDHIGRHIVAGDGQVVGEHHGSRTMRSGRGDEHLYMERFFKALQESQCLRH